MKSYPEDLRHKIVAAVERGMSKAEVARLFNVSLSSVKRYSQGWSVRELPRSNEGTWQDPEGSGKAKKLLNEDMKERPAATIAGRIRFLQSITAKRLSYSAVWRLLKHLGWTLPTTLYELTTPRRCASAQRWESSRR